MFTSGFRGGAYGKEPAWRHKRHAGDSRDLGSVPGWGRSPRGGCGNQLQYSCLENPVDRGVWRATVHGVAWMHSAVILVLPLTLLFFSHPSGSRFYHVYPKDLSSVYPLLFILPSAIFYSSSFCLSEYDHNDLLICLLLLLLSIFHRSQSNLVKMQIKLL